MTGSAGSTNLSRERFLSYHRGWHDGAARRLQRPEFVNHPTRPDLTKEYLKGYNSGAGASMIAMYRAAKRLKFEPDILRDCGVPK